MDPEKLFLPDGSLGEAGILMKSLYRKLFEENRGGVRIDHTIGLIDPWVYKDGFKPLYEEGGGRLYSSPELEDLKQYAIPKMEDIDETVLPDEEMRVKTLSEEQLARYALFLEKIVIAAACESGLDKDSIICEDLGSTTHPVVEVMKRTGLQGMRVTPFADPNDPKHPYRCKNIPHESWAMVGTHDNQPLLNWTESIVYTHTSYLHALNLMEDLWPDISEHEKEEMVVRMTKDAKFLAFIKYVELFASKADNIQIFFSDLFGFKEVYNIPGTSEENNNWALRIPVDYEEIYEENCANGRAMELVSILKAAIEARGEKFAAEHSDLLDRMEHLLTVNS